LNELERLERVIGEWEAQGGEAARLASQRRWVCRKGKTPIDPNTGRPANIRRGAKHKGSGQPLLVCLFTAREALRHMKAGRCDGIGVVTGDFDALPLCGIDMDHCVINGVVAEGKREAAAMICRHGYFELSPSGTGIRGLVLCKKPEGYRMKNSGAGVEVYFDGQYVTVTGKRVRGADTPLGADDSAVRYLCKTYLREQERATVPQEVAAPSARLQTAIERDRAFAALWNGDRPNGNESGDDQALMNKLAYWLDCNEAAMIEAFNASPHATSKDAEHRKKMQRKDYLSRTTRRAIQDCRETASQADAAYQAERRERRANPADKSVNGPVIVRACDVPYEAPKWLIAPYFQRGKGTLIQGDNGLGKTAFMCGIVAHVSTGEPLLDLPVEAPGDALILSVEDDLPILRGRIEASGGDLTRCHFMKNAAGLTLNSPEVEEAVKQTKAKLLLFDPLQAFLGAKVDMFRANETRPELSKLFEMCARNDCACAIIAHTGKGSSDKSPVNRSLGSVDIPSASRSIFHLTRNPENEAELVAVHVKSSNAPKGRGLAYTIGNRGGVIWTGFKDIDEKDLDSIIKRQEKGVPYEKEPLVAVLRQLIANKPGGGFWAYSDLSSEGAKILGFPAFAGVGDLRSRLDKGLARELQARDGILVTHSVKGRGNARGVRVEQYKNSSAFQCGMDIPTGGVLSTDG